MKDQNINNAIEIPSIDKISLKDENDNLIESLNDNSINSNMASESLISGRKKDIKETIIKALLNTPLIIIFFYITVTFAFIITLIYTIYYFSSKSNFKIVNLDWIITYKNDRKYQDYIFDNGLEVMLIQDKLFDRDGASIVIENGYMEYPKEEGIAAFATYLLNAITIIENKKIDKNFKDYYGLYNFAIDENFIHFSFEILNNGFKKFLYYFSNILNPTSFSDLYAKYKDLIIEAINSQYFTNSINIYNKESHLIDYLVYNLKDDNNEDILPEGNRKILEQYDDEFLKNRVLEYINYFIDPSNIKIVIFSKYKFLITAKYMKKYFQYLTSMEKSNKAKIEENKFVPKDLKKSQIFYIKGQYHNPNFLEIIYFIDKVKNESYSELYFKANYLRYIMDFINEKREGSLYYLLTNNSNFNIKSVSAGYEISFKSELEFFIFIELNCLENINDLIFITYQYIHKIIKEAIGEQLQMGRILELKNLFDQNELYTDKTFEAINLAKNIAEELFLTKYNRKYFFYNGFIPWDDNDKDNENNIKKESSLYFKQIRPENSVIILGLKEDDINNITCNNNSKFYLNCSYFKEEKNVKHTKYYEIEYINDTFNASDFEEYLDSNIEANITFEKNTFISKHDESFIDIKEEEDKTLTKLDNETIFHKFFFKRNTKFRLPKVFISLDLFHPYLRPMLEDKNETRCYYFKIIEFYSAIKRKIIEDLGDAIRAGNQFEFGQSENSLIIRVFCYEDVAYKIMEKIKNIIYDTNWELTDFIPNNKMYKIDTFLDYLTFNRLSVGVISIYYFLSKLKNHLYNKFEFFPKEFENEYYQTCINSFDYNEFKYLTTFIINGYIYGHYTKESAQDISNLFKTNNTIEDFGAILKKVNNTEIIDGNPETFINWIKEIKQLDESDSVIINPKTYNRQCYDCYSCGVTYVKFDQSVLEVSLISSILEKTGTAGNLIDFGMYKYGDIFYILLFATNDITERVPNDFLLNITWYYTLSNIYDFNENVDNIGNRYYYVKKNFIFTLFKEQTSLYQKALYEIHEYSYEGTVLDPVKIMELYNEKYKNKEFDNTELNKTISSFLNILERKRFDVYTVE